MKRNFGKRGSALILAIFIGLSMIGLPAFALEDEDFVDSGHAYSEEVQPLAAPADGSFVRVPVYIFYSDEEFSARMAQLGIGYQSDGCAIGVLELPEKFVEDVGNWKSWGDGRRYNDTIWDEIRGRSLSMDTSCLSGDASANRGNAVWEYLTENPELVSGGGATYLYRESKPSFGFGEESFDYHLDIAIDTAKVPVQVPVYVYGYDEADRFSALMEGLGVGYTVGGGCAIGVLELPRETVRDGEDWNRWSDGRPYDDGIWEKIRGRGLTVDASGLVGAAAANRDNQVWEYLLEHPALVATGDGMTYLYKQTKPIGDLGDTRYAYHMDIRLDLSSLRLIRLAGRYQIDGKVITMEEAAPYRDLYLPLGDFGSEAGAALRVDDMTEITETVRTRLEELSIEGPEQWTENDLFTDEKCTTPFDPSAGLEDGAFLYCTRRIDGNRSDTVQVSVYATSGYDFDSGYDAALFDQMMGFSYQQQEDAYYTVGVMELPRSVFEGQEIGVIGASAYLREDNVETVKRYLEKTLDTSVLQNLAVGNKGNIVAQNADYVDWEIGIENVGSTYKTALIPAINDDPYTLTGTYGYSLAGAPYDYHLDLLFKAAIANYVGYYVKEDGAPLADADAPGGNSRVELGGKVWLLGKELPVLADVDEGIDPEWEIEGYYLSEEDFRDPEKAIGIIDEGENRFLKEKLLEDGMTIYCKITPRVTLEKRAEITRRAPGNEGLGGYAGKGDTVTYTLTVKNWNSSIQQTVAVTDSLSGIAADALPNGVAYADGVFTVTLPKAARNGELIPSSVEITYTYVVTTADAAAGTIRNLAAVGGHTAETETPVKTGSDPDPTDPNPATPNPTDQNPTDPKPTNPGLTNPGPTDPNPTTPVPTDPNPTTPTTPNPITPNAPADSAGPPNEAAPVRGTRRRITEVPQIALTEEELLDIFSEVPLTRITVDDLLEILFEVPLARVPKTGGNSWNWECLTLLSGAGLISLKKKERESTAV